MLDDEIVPIGDAPGRFDGFANQADVVKLAEGSPEATVVVNDGKRFHVLRSTATTLGGKATAPTLPKGWTVIEVKEPTDTAPDDAFAQDYRAAREFVRVRPGDEVSPPARPGHAPRGRRDRVGRRADQRYVEGKVNVALWLPTAGRHLPPKVVPTGTTRRRGPRS